MILNTCWLRHATILRKFPERSKQQGLTRTKHMQVKIEEKLNAKAKETPDTQPASFTPQQAKVKAMLEQQSSGHRASLELPVVRFATIMLSQPSCPANTIYPCQDYRSASWPRWLTYLMDLPLLDDLHSTVIPIYHTKSVWWGYICKHDLPTGSSSITWVSTNLASLLHSGIILRRSSRSACDRVARYCAPVLAYLEQEESLASRRPTRTIVSHLRSMQAVDNRSLEHSMGMVLQVSQQSHNTTLLLMSVPSPCCVKLLPGEETSGLALLLIPCNLLIFVIPFRPVMLSTQHSDLICLEQPGSETDSNEE